jgi:hypothetical protein
MRSMWSSSKWEAHRQHDVLSINASKSWKDWVVRGSNETCNNMSDSLSSFFPGVGGAEWGRNGGLL